MIIREACGGVIVCRECSGGRMGPHAGGTIDDWSEPHPTCPSLFVTPPCPLASLSCIHLASFRLPLRISKLATRSYTTVITRKNSLLRLPDSSAHPALNSSRHSHSFARNVSYTTQTRLRRHRNRHTLCLIDLNRLPVLSFPTSPQSALPIHL